MKERDRRMRSYVHQDDRNHPSLGLFLFHFLLTFSFNILLGHSLFCFLLLAQLNERKMFENEIRDVLENNFFLSLDDGSQSIPAVIIKRKKNCLRTSLEREASVITYWFHRIRKRRLEPCGTK